MTINYDGSFVKALFTWKGSVWKAIWIELLIYTSAYFTLRFTLHFVVYKGHSAALSPYVELFAKNVMKLPLDLFMGFFINQAVSRWWGQVIMRCVRPFMRHDTMRQYPLRIMAPSFE